MTDTLVAVSHGGRTVAVTRDAHGAWLDGNGIGPGGRAVTTFADGTWVVGGLLPDGAERAVVRDVAGSETEAACGAGAWIATSSDEDPAVRFETPDGRIVAAPPAARLQPGRHPGDFEYVTPAAVWVTVQDALDPCPACDALAWASASDSVRCTRCGHQTQGWVAYAGAPASADREPVEPSEAAASETWTRRTSLRLTLEELRGATVLVVADSTRQPRLGSRSASEGRATAVSIHHGDDLRIETTWDAEPDPLDGRYALQAMVRDAAPSWPDLSAPALGVWLDAQDRATRHAVAIAEPLAHEIEVERVAVAFAGLRSGSSWSLVGRIAGASVVISGRGDLPHRLRRVRDPVYELVGR